MKMKLILSAFLLGLITTLFAQKTSTLPNVVIFIGDDLAAQDIGPYGNRVVRTPHLDTLARESMVFDKAFASSPTCGPSRSSLFTAMYPFRHGAHGNHSAVQEGTLSMVQRLSSLGYRVAIAGKLHLGPKSVFPFECIAGTNVREPGYEKIDGLYHDLNLDPVDAWLAQQPANHPFVLIVSDHSPHVIWPEKPTYNAAEIDIPPIHIDTKETRRARARYYTDVTKMDDNVGRTLALLTKHRLAERAMFLFTADQGPQWAFGKWGLYDYGIRVPFIIRWPGHVPAGTRTNALVSQIDVLPTLVELAGGRIPAGEIDGVSFLPILYNAQAKHRNTVFASHTGDGQMNRSPMRMLRTTRYKYILNIAPNIPYHTHMDKATDHDGGREYWASWREASFSNPHASAVLWRYHNRPSEELYDIDTDPWEQVNLAADSEYAPLLADFRIQLAAVRKQQGDDREGPEPAAPAGSNQKDGKPIAPYIF